MPEIFIHEHEQGIDDDFIKSKREAFESDAKFLLDLLYRGWRLNGRQVEMWGINSRRLRELVVSHKEIKRDWKMENGKRIVMEYWLEIPPLPTKKELIQWHEESKSTTPVIPIESNRRFTQTELKF